jgi:hypothetical protein
MLYTVMYWGGRSYSKVGEFNTLKEAQAACSGDSRSRDTIYGPHWPQAYLNDCISLNQRPSETDYAEYLTER